jgi:putative FmdB family regulatory protein
MPLYDYACTKCGHVREVRHGFGESYDEPCEACGGALRRVFNPAPVLFKGSGFYVTDSRRSGPGKTDKPKDEAKSAASAKPEAAASSDSKSDSSNSSDSAA